MLSVEKHIYLVLNNPNAPAVDNTVNGDDFNWGKEPGTDVSDDEPNSSNKDEDTEVKDDDIKFVTITAVDISSDLSYAKVYFTTLEDDKKEVVTKALNRASGFIRSKLCDVVDLRKMLGGFEFYGDMVFLPVKSLSGGQKVKLLLCKIMRHQPNLLILDEPTNHLDIIGRETIERLLLQYKGQARILLRK